MSSSDTSPALPVATPAGSDGFDAFYARTERPLAVALGTHDGPQVGREAAVDALSWAWEH